MKSVLLNIVLPAAIVAALYLVFLSHRSDYAGHFLAGFGGTLFSVAAAHRLLQGDHDRIRLRPLVLLVCLGCIAVGTLFEATIFRLAKFDEVDYCNQNIGAILASLSSPGVLPEPGEESDTIAPALALTVVSLFAGFVYAFS